MEINISDISAEVQQAKLRFGIIGNNKALINDIQRAIQVAPIDLSVLISGESGTGKEFFPQIIHAFSARRHGKYKAVNCGAIPEGTVDSELFGHEKGSFTGAVSSRKGYFEEADGGTIFLDEVAELPLTTQARLLRVLETGEFMRVGSSEVKKTNIRVVAATNVDMMKAVADGKFREDLYYRLSTVQISVPPLRDRGNDIILLARKFAGDFSERYRTPQIEIDESARHLLMSYRWPGNVRQLKNVIEQIALFEAGNRVTEDSVRQYIPQNATVYAPALVESARSHDYANEREILFNMIFKMRNDIDSLRNMVEKLSGSKPAENLIPAEHSRSLVKFCPDHGSPISCINADDVTDMGAEDPDGTQSNQEVHTLEDTERETIRRSLERNSGRRKATAKELNISERTLYRKIREYGLE